jgi:hypothetical protein
VSRAPEAPEPVRQVYTEEVYQQVIDLALARFWGNAKLSDGSFVQPESEEDRGTLPIPYVDAKRVVDSSIPAGLAVWCGIDYIPYYTLYMKVERRRKSWNDKQSAFVGFLFGVSQGIVERSVRAQACDNATKANVSKTLTANTEALQRLLK